MKHLAALITAARMTSRAVREPERTELSAGWLFAMATEPLLLVDAATGKIVDANPAAAALLRTSNAGLPGTRLLTAFAASSARALEQSFAVACMAGSAPPLAVHSVDSRSKLSVALSLIRTGPDAYVLARLASALSDGKEAPHSTAPSAVEELLEDTSDGFLLTDAGLRVEYANPAFVNLVKLSSPEEVQGQSATQWLCFSHDVFALLRQQTWERQAVTVLATTVRCSGGSTFHAEVQAVSVPDGQEPCWGFIVRQLTTHLS